MCVCVCERVPSCRLDVDIGVSAGLNPEQHVSIINVWYKNAHSVYPFVELQISTAPVATASMGEESNGSHVEHLSSTVNTVCDFTATMAVRLVLH